MHERVMGVVLPWQVSLTGGGMMRVGNDDYKAAIVGYDEDKDVAVLKIAVEQAKVRRLAVFHAEDR